MMPAVLSTKKGQKTREHLRRVACNVIERDGYIALRMGDVRSVAEVSLGALYQFFEYKDDLFLSLIGDIHKELYETSRVRKHNFRADPLATLEESNEGYLVHCFANRDMMRAFIEVTTIDMQVCDMWWWMRQRHVNCFIAALKRDFNVVEVDGIFDPLHRRSVGLCGRAKCIYLVCARKPERFSDLREDHREIARPALVSRHLGRQRSEARWSCPPRCQRSHSARQTAITS